MTVTACSTACTPSTLPVRRKAKARATTSQSKAITTISCARVNAHTHVCVCVCACVCVRVCRHEWQSDAPHRIIWLWFTFLFMIQRLCMLSVHRQVKSITS